jgi:hypothetical protein
LPARRSVRWLCRLYSPGELLVVACIVPIATVACRVKGRGPPTVVRFLSAHPSRARLIRESTRVCLESLFCVQGLCVNLK